MTDFSEALKQFKSYQRHIKAVTVIGEAIGEVVTLESDLASLRTQYDEAKVALGAKKGEITRAASDLQVSRDTVDANNATAKLIVEEANRDADRAIEEAKLTARGLIADAAAEVAVAKETAAQETGRHQKSLSDVLRREEEAADRLATIEARLAAIAQTIQGEN